MLVLDELVLHGAQMYRREVIASSEDAYFNKENDLQHIEHSSFDSTEDWALVCAG